MGIAVSDYNKNGKHYFTINQTLKTGGMGKFKMAKCYEISEVIQNLRYKNFYIPRS